MTSILTQAINLFKTLFLTTEPIVWIFTNPVWFLTAPLFSLWWNWMMFVGKALTIALPFKPYFVKSGMTDVEAVSLYVASWKYHLNRWFGWFPKATYQACSEYFGWTP